MDHVRSKVGQDPSHRTARQSQLEFGIKRKPLGGQANDARALKIVDAAIRGKDQDLVAGLP